MKVTENCRKCLPGKMPAWKGSMTQNSDLQEGFLHLKPFYFHMNCPIKESILFENGICKK